MYPEFLSNLPSHWQLLPMHEACRFTSKPRDLNFQDFPELAFVPMELIPTGTLKFSRHSLKQPSAITSGTYFEEGDFLLSKITPCFENGKQGIVESVPNGFGIATTEVIPIKARPRLTHLPFVAYYFLDHEVRHQIAAAMEGATGRQRLPKDLLSDWPVPIPPEEEQRAIADLLDTIQRAVSAQNATAQKAAQLKSATMAKLFREGLRGELLKQTEIGEIPESWDLVRLGDRCRPRSGGTPSRAVSKYWAGTIPWVKTTEINYREITQTEEKITEEGLRNSAAKIFDKGTLLMAMYGQGVTRGRVAILGIAAATNQACAAFFPDATLRSNFLYAYFTHAYEQIREIGHGANQRNLSVELLEGIKVPIPRDTGEQEEIFKIAADLQRRVELSQDKAEALSHLFSATLHALMTGCVRLPAKEALHA